MAKNLTQRQRAFIETYDGNGTAAARRAGYKGSDNALAKTAHELLRNPAVREALEQRQRPESEARIATREERQAFWTSVMRDTSQAIEDRLRASELLGRSEADFTERVSTDAGFVINLVDPYSKPEQPPPHPVVPS